MNKLLLLVIGGSLGTLSRYYFSTWVQHVCGTHFPYGTFAVNLLGCLLMGILLAVAEQTQWLSPGIRLMLATGFLGAMTTFSTLELEAFTLIREGAVLRMAVYMGLSMGLGLLLLWGGYALARLILPATTPG